MDGRRFGASGIPATFPSQRIYGSGTAAAATRNRNHAAARGDLRPQNETAGHEHPGGFGIRVSFRAWRRATGGAAVVWSPGNSTGNARNTLCNFTLLRLDCAQAAAGQKRSGRGAESEGRVLPERKSAHLSVTRTRVARAGLRRSG